MEAYEELNDKFHFLIKERENLINELKSERVKHQS